MFTKALVVETPENEDNHYKVRIPIFEDTTGDEVIFDALACHAPGVFNGYNVGDCVYVAFEDDKMNIPVILGKLYIEEQDDYAKGYFNNLNVASKAQLPMSTTFGNGLSINNLYNTIQYLESVNDRIGGSEGWMSGWPANHTYVRPTGTTNRTTNVSLNFNNVVTNAVVTGTDLSITTSPVTITQPTFTVNTTDGTLVHVKM